MSDRGPLIPKHGGYRKLKSFQIAQLVYDITVRFCDLYVDNSAARVTRWCRQPAAGFRTSPKVARLQAHRKRQN